MVVKRNNLKGAFNGGRYAFAHIHGVLKDGVVIVFPSDMRLTEENVAQAAKRVLNGIEHHIGHYIDIRGFNNISEKSLCLEFPDCDYELLKERVLKVLSICQMPCAIAKWTKQYELLIFKKEGEMKCQGGIKYLDSITESKLYKHLVSDGSWAVIGRIIVEHETSDTVLLTRLKSRVASL